MGFSRISALVGVLLVLRLMVSCVENASIDQEEFESLVAKVEELERRVAAFEPPKVADIDIPEWAKRGSAVIEEPRGKVCYGVGSVGGIKNHALARVTADNRARAEIAKAIKTEVAVAEDSSSQAIKTFAVATLEGVQIVDHWLHPDGTVYALAELVGGACE